MEFICEEDDCKFSIELVYKKFGGDIASVSWNKKSHSHDDIEVDHKKAIKELKKYWNSNKAVFHELNKPKEEILKQCFYAQKKKFLICERTITSTKGLK